MKAEFYQITYKLMASIFSLIDFLREIVDVLSGNGSEDMLVGFITSKSVSNAFLIVLLIGFVLLLVFTMMAIIKSETDREKKSKGEILGASLKGFLSFLVIPFILIAGVMLCSVIMQAVDQGMSGMRFNTRGTIGVDLLLTVAHDAYSYDEASRVGIEKAIEMGEINYLDPLVIGGYYDLEKINYFVGIFGGIVILVMLFLAAIVFIQKIFDVVLLYIVSPIPVSSIPLDNGERFSTWRELVIGKLVSAYGIIISLNLFFLIVPVASSSISFNDPFKDGLTKVLFMIGGTFAVTKANILIASLAGKSAARGEMFDVISNMRTSRAIGSSISHSSGTLVSGLLGGRSYFDNKKSGGNINAISKMFSRKGRVIETKREGKKMYFLRTKGILKDLVSGGLVRTIKDVAATAKKSLKG